LVFATLYEALEIFLSHSPSA